jgi:hypothetical protein
MDTGYVDAIAGGSFLLLTGTEVMASDTIIELISKFGVIAVLWFWLKDMKDQVKALTKIYEKENNEAREHSEKMLTSIKEEYKDYKDRSDKQLEQASRERDELHKRIQELTVNKKS